MFKKNVIGISIFFIIMLICSIVFAEENEHMSKVFENTMTEIHSSGNWKVIACEDQMDESLIDYVIMATSENRVEGVFQKEDVHIIVSYLYGIYFGSDIKFEAIDMFSDYSKIRLKFDDGDVMSFDVKTNGHFIYLGEKFLDELRSSQNLILEFEPFYGTGRKVVKFNVNGIDEIYEAIDSAGDE